MYECIVHRDHVPCSCPYFKYNTLCKQSLWVAQTVDILKKHVDYVVVKLSTTKNSRSGLVVPAKKAAGKKGGTHKNAWHPQRQESSHFSSVPVKLFSQIHHYNRPIKVCFLSDEAKAIACRQCGKVSLQANCDPIRHHAIPRRKVDVPQRQQSGFEAAIFTVHNKILLCRWQMCHSQVSLLKREVVSRYQLS